VHGKERARTLLDLHNKPEGRRERCANHHTMAQMTFIKLQLFLPHTLWADKRAKL